MTFEAFLKDFIPVLSRKSKQLNQASWLLDTTGLQDAAELKAELDIEFRMLFNDRSTYEKLLDWDKDPALKDPALKRQLNILLRNFKENMMPPEILRELSMKETELARTYTTFRPTLDGKALSENDLKEILKNEKSPEQRKKAWNTSKEIGVLLAPQILALVHLRNQGARSLGYSDFFQMRLALQEVEEKPLLQMLNQLSERSDKAYRELIEEIENRQCREFSVKRDELGPWAWADPFCQEDPLDSSELDELVKGIDIVSTSKAFFDRMGYETAPIVAKSDFFEREGKNQHAFCINIDRAGDVRTLNNVTPSIRWLETVLHELGHAVYELGFDTSLPWLLREPPHMIPTEAMALISGRQAYRFDSLKKLVPHKDQQIMRKAEISLKRRQLIFSRWVLVMTHFERELYRNPDQDLNRLWWQLVEKYQMVRPPKNRNDKQDWAAKYHIGLAPVYYFSYLLGEMFASCLQEHFPDKELDTPHSAWFLKQRLFHPGNSLSWDKLIESVIDKPLSPDAWLNEFCV